MGRPQKEIDQKIFENLCGLLCTEEEIASMFDCSVDTISRWCQRTYGESFAEIYKKKSAKGRISLRRAQFKLAEKNAAMAIFLGKQHLGQRDIPIPNDQRDNNLLAAIRSAEEVDTSDLPEVE
jgi:AraC-like DNA-binding protein